MKKYLIYLIGLLAVFPTSFLQAQKWMDMWRNPTQYSFYEIQKEFNNYFEAHPKDKGTGYTHFKRWEYYMAPRVGPDGKILNFQALTWQNYLEYLQERGFSATKTNSPNGNWVFLGAEDHFKGTSGYNGGIGRINVIRFHPTDPNTIYAGAPAGGLWRTTNHGGTWTPLTDGMTFWGCSGIAIEPADPNHIYNLTGDGDGGSSPTAGVWESTDGGATWTATGLNINYVTTFDDGYKLMMDPSNSSILYACMSSGLYKTVDAGVTWTNIRSGVAHDMEFQPGNSNTIYIASGGSIYRSVNAGTTWTLVTTISGAGRIALGVSPANSNYVYALGGGVPASGQFAGLYRSTDAGVTWTLRSNTPNILGYSNTGNDASSQAWYDLAIAVSPSNIDEIYTGGINVWKSVNGGTTWTNTSYWIEGTPGSGYTHADIHELVFNGSSLYCGSDGGTYYTTNAAVNWNDMSSGLGITEIYRFGGTPQNGALYIGGAQDNGSNIWEGPLPDLVMEHVYGADGMEAAIDFTNQNVMYSTHQGGGLKRSTDGGDNWTGITPGNLGGGGWVTPYVLNPLRANTILAGYSDVGINYNRGTGTWINLTSATGGSGAIVHLEFAPSDTNTMYAVWYSSVWRTNNHGTTWTNISTGLPGFGYTYIAVNPSNANHIFVTVSNWTANSKIYESTDGGATWTNFSGTALPNVPANCVVYEAGSADGVYIGTDAGVYYRDDNLTDWIDFSTGLPFCRVMEMEINYPVGQLRAATYGRSIWESDLYGAACPVDLVLTGNVTGTQIFEASNSITSDQTLVVPANITYQAGNYISLIGGFTVPMGAVFNAIIGPCSARMAQPISGVFVPGDPNADPNAPTGPADGYGFGIYPNPIRSWGWMRLELPKKSSVKVDIYDAALHKVATVLEGEKEAGVHTLQIDASNLPAGIYIFNFNSDSYSTSVKVAVTR